MEKNARDGKLRANAWFLSANHEINFRHTIAPTQSQQLSRFIGVVAESAGG